MQVPISWIADYVDVDMDADQLAAALTMAGLETTNLGSAVPDIEGVITAKIEKIEQHPDADKLSYCQVIPGEGEPALAIVCGAPNIKEGDIVPLARIGTILPDGTKLKKTKIRGVESQGMMCSERELGMSEDHSGIWILPPETPIGKPLPEALGEDDSILEPEPTPNRGDLMSVIGIAREVSAITGKKLSMPEFKVKEDGPAIEDDTRVDIEDYDKCPRYAARLIKGVKIGPSPEWLVKNLEAAGQRSINNVVDITNFVMLEMGQPLHAFDFNRLRDHRIVVKTANEGDKFTTLDGEERTLRDDTLMICDGEGPVAIAGVMGGLDSEVTEETTDVLLESAYFKPTSIRRTARLLGIPTEASKRFDKGIDPLGTIYAADRAAQLMAELAGGTISKGVIDAKETDFERVSITLRPERANLILGSEISKDEQASLLARLDGMEVKTDGDLIVAKAPSYRPDLLAEHDLIEEVARLHGYDSIEPTMPSFRMEPLRNRNERELAMRLRERLAALGFHEVINTNFEDPKRLALMRFEEGETGTKAVSLANPLSENESILRTTLVPKLLSTYVMNRSRGYTGPVRIYELNAVYEDTGEELPVQRTMISGVAAGSLDKELYGTLSPSEGFYEVKGFTEQILHAVGFPGARVEQERASSPFLHPGKSAKVMVGKADAGVLGEIHPVVSESFEIGGGVFIFELYFDMLNENAGYVPRAKPVSKYPSALRDIAVVVDESVTMEEIMRAAMKMKSPYLKNITVFDVFRGGALAGGKKSMAFHVRYQSGERTLTDEEINKEHDKLAEQLKRRVGASLR